MKAFTVIWNCVKLTSHYFIP